MTANLPIFALVIGIALISTAKAQVPSPVTRQPAVRPAARAAATAPSTAQPAPQPVRPAASTAPPAAENITGDLLVERVVQSVDSQYAIRAKVRSKVELLDHSLAGTGSYWQQGRGPLRLLRYELVAETEGHTSSVLQICDGTNLWMRESLGDYTNLSRVDLARLRRARPKAGQTPTRAVPDAWIALGGVPRLLTNMQSSFRFAPPVERRLDNLRVWAIEGRWKPERLAQLLPNQKETIESGGAVDLGSLGPNVPDSVVLHVGCDDLFPYRIEYWRTRKGKDSGDSSARNLIVVMEFYEVQLGVPGDPREFVFKPGEAVVADRTQEFFDRLNLEEFNSPGASARPPRRR